MTLKIELSGWQGSQGTSKSQLNLSGTPGEWLVSEGQHRARYRFTREFVQGKEVLDAGCGNGYGSVTLLKAGARSVTGLDISEEAIAEAKVVMLPQICATSRETCTNSPSPSRALM